MKSFVGQQLDSLIFMNLILKGRYTLEGDKIKFYNAGSSVRFRVRGGVTSIEISTEKGPGFVHVIRDFDYENREKILIKNSKKIEISFLDNEPHFVDIVKTNEASDNFLIFGPISTTGKMLDIEKKDKKFIQVYGDSSIAGYGILAHEGEPNYLNNDGVENFCFKALYSLDFDYDIFAASGWGLTFSAWTTPKETGIEKFSDKICVNSDIKFPQKTPDFLMISLGTNDMAYILENPKKAGELQEIFAKSYENFIKKEREKKPQIPVLMVYGSLKEEHVYDLIENTYKKVSQKLPNIHLLKFDGDHSAIASHSFVTAHPQMAEKLKEKIIQILSE